MADMFQPLGYTLKNHLRFNKFTLWLKAANVQANGPGQSLRCAWNDCLGNVAVHSDVRFRQMDGSHSSIRITMGQTLKEEAALFTSSSSILFCSCLSSSLLVNLTNQRGERKKKKQSQNFNSNLDKAETQQALHCATLPFHLIRVVFGRRTWLVRGGRLCTGHWGWFQLILCRDKRKEKHTEGWRGIDYMTPPWPRFQVEMAWNSLNVRSRQETYNNLLIFHGHKRWQST